jgi:hypothetical protein
VVLPTVAFGGASLLTMILGQQPGYLDNPLRQTSIAPGTPMPQSY